MSSNTASLESSSYKYVVSVS